MPGDSLGRPLRCLVEPGGKFRRMVFELAADLIVMGFELIGQSGGRCFEEIARLLRAFAQLRGKAVVRGGETFVEGASLNDHRLMHALAGLLETRDEAVAMGQDRLVQTGAAGVDAVGKVAAARRELARQRVGALGEATQNAIAMREDRLRSACAGRVDEADKRVAARSEFIRRRIAGLREPRNDAFAMRENRIGSARAAGIHQVDERLVARSELVRRSLRWSASGAQ